MRLSNWPGWISCYRRIGRDVAYQVAPEAKHGASAEIQIIHYAGAAANVTVGADGRAPGNSYIRANKAPVFDRNIMMDHGVGKNADVIANDTTAGDHYTSHYEHVVANCRERRDSRRGMNDSREPFFVQSQAGDDLAPGAE